MHYVPGLATCCAWACCVLCPCVDLTLGSKEWGVAGSERLAPYIAKHWALTYGELHGIYLKAFVASNSLHAPLSLHCLDALASIIPLRTPCLYVCILYTHLYGVQPVLQAAEASLHLFHGSKCARLVTKLNRGVRLLE